MFTNLYANSCVLALLTAVIVSPARADIVLLGGTSAQRTLLRGVIDKQIPVQWCQHANVRVSIDPTWSKSGKSPADCTLDGFYDEQTMRIALRGTQDKCALPYTFVHEFGHYFWQNEIDGAQRSRYWLVYSRQKKMGRLVTAYADTNLQEGFAEAFAYYVLSQETLRRRDPISLAYFDSLRRAPLAPLGTNRASQPVKRPL